jgi:membrane protein DedA with SNARE-associated domain
MLCPVNDALDAILQFVQGLDPLLRLGIAGLGMFFETSILLGLIVPGDSIVLVASTAVEGGVQFVSLILVVVIGSLAGESVGFALGHHFGPAIRHSRLGSRLGERNWVRAERYLQRRGGIAVFVSRFLPVLHSLIPITVGMGEMRYRAFLRWTAPACVLWAIAYVAVGTFTAGGYRELADRLHYAGYLFAGAIVLFLALVLIIRKLIERSQARHMEPRAGHGEDVSR